jgi:hypothetical protein
MDPFLFSECPQMNATTNNTTPFNTMAEFKQYLSVVSLDYCISVVHVLVFTVFFCVVFSAEKVTLLNPTKVQLESWTIIWMNIAWFAYEISRIAGNYDRFPGGMNQAIVASLLGFRTYIIVFMVFLFVKIFRGSILLLYTQN